MIQELSFIHPEAKIGANVEIGPFVYIDKNVEIGDGCVIMAHATILSGARIGKNVRIFPNLKTLIRIVQFRDGGKIFVTHLFTRMLQSRIYKEPEEVRKRQAI